MIQQDVTRATAVKNSNKKITITLALLLVISAGAFGWSFYKYTQTKKQLMQVSSIEGQKAIAQKEVNALLEKVKKHMVLPEGEEPVVATVTDKEALSKEQPFYANAHNGDRVIAYMTARKAIIYDPIRDVIVNAGPIYVDNTAGQQQQIQNQQQATTTNK